MSALRHSHFLLALLCMTAAAAAQAQAATEPCAGHSEQMIRFRSMVPEDILKVDVSGAPCSKAVVSITVSAADGRELYTYRGALIEHMPFLIYEPELNTLVSFYVTRVLTEAARRFTADLPPYTNLDDYYAATNDFVVIPIPEYNLLRTHNQPLLWHTTGDASWVNVIYDPATQSGKVVLRGGVFQPAQP